MKNIKNYIIILMVIFNSCKVPKIVNRGTKSILPTTFTNGDSGEASISKLSWKEYFSDQNLINLIDSALVNNLDIAKAMQQIEMAKSGVLYTSGALKPTISFSPTTSIRRFGLYTMDGAGNITTDILPNKIVPTHLPDFFAGFTSTWEIDLNGKLRNRNKAAQARLLASEEGKNLVITTIVAEVATAYYELLALDNEINTINEYIEIQENAVDLVKTQKEAAATNELAVKQFEAQLFNLQEMRFEILQKIVENENKINFLIGRFPQPIQRTSRIIESYLPKPLIAGLPSDLLINRPDLRQAELNLIASNLDVSIARAAFLPSLNINALIGSQAFRPDFLVTKPASLAYGLLGGLTAPFINKNAIQAEFNFATASQLETLYNYNQQIIGAYTEVHNLISLYRNLEQSTFLKTKQSEVLNQSIGISNELFRNNRATYLEVLTAQQNALETKLTLIELYKSQLQSSVNIYKALGGGWR